ncbi:MAG: ribosome-binding factor A [Gammaproteobacteria bacterium TMED78]|nr:MAG: ribosome-binding factor A [Gammaproteobacteria bacterium TMED78]|tara:strand:- start:3933 stop:4289 length:357 start_codon:yes stop_codon:yes gene_type:complete
MPREFSRNIRIASELQRFINNLLQQGIKDPRLRGITISSVTMNDSSGKALVLFSTLDLENNEEESTLAALNSAKGFIRQKFGQKMKIRNVPELIFERDSGPDTSIRISKLIDEAINKK